MYKPSRRGALRTGQRTLFWRRPLPAARRLGVRPGRGLRERQLRAAPRRTRASRRHLLQRRLHGDGPALQRSGRVRAADGRRWHDLRQAWRLALRWRTGLQGMRGRRQPLHTGGGVLRCLSGAAGLRQRHELRLSSPAQWWRLHQVQRQPMHSFAGRRLLPADARLRPQRAQLRSVGQPVQGVRRRRPLRPQRGVQQRNLRMRVRIEALRQRAMPAQRPVLRRLQPQRSRVQQRNLRMLGGAAPLPGRALHRGQCLLRRLRQRHLRRGRVPEPGQRGRDAWQHRLRPGRGRCGPGAEGRDHQQPGRPAIGCAGHHRRWNGRRLCVRLRLPGGTGGQNVMYGHGDRLQRDPGGWS